LIGTTLSNFYTYWATNTITSIITICMHASIFGTHVVEANFELHKLIVVFVATCIPLLFVLHELGLQIGKCCELNHDIMMLFLECNEKFYLQHKN
jgi:Na+/H+-dicarboxylate symporter